MEFELVPMPKEVTEGFTMVIRLSTDKGKRKMSINTIASCEMDKIEREIKKADRKFVRAIRKFAKGEKNAKPRKVHT